MYYNKETDTLNVGKIVKHVVLGLVALIIVFGSFVTVQAGEVAVKTRLGKVVGTMGPGLHGKLPVIESVYRMDVKTRVVKNEHYVNEDGKTISDNPLDAASKDLQNVKVSVVFNYAVDQSKVMEIYTKYRTISAFEEGVVKPILKQEVKAVTALYTADELVGKRAELNDKVSESIRAAVMDKGAIFEQSSVTNIEFSESFTASIEKKVTAEQDALAAKNRLEQIKYEGEQKIVSAKAEAESIRIQSQAINSQGGADYVQLQAINKWNGQLPTQMIPGSTVPFINLHQ